MMAKTPTAFELWKIGFDMTRLAAEAQLVVAIRLAGMAGLWKLAPGETARMVTEKQHAFAQAALDVGVAALKGQRYDQIVAAAIRPLGRKTSANARRLGRSAARQHLRTMGIRFKHCDRAAMPG